MQNRKLFNFSTNFTNTFFKLQAVKKICVLYAVHRQNVPRQNVLRHKVPRTKRPKGQNVPGTKRPRDKTSQRTKRPKGQNVPSKKKLQLNFQFFKNRFCLQFFENGPHMLDITILCRLGLLD